jgi:hypothetical protein
MSLFWLRFIGLTAKVIDRTKTVADVYGAFFDFASMLESKVWSIPGPKQIMFWFVTKESGCYSSFTPDNVPILCFILVISLIVSFERVKKRSW